MLVEEAEALSSDAALGPAQIQTGLQVVNVENDFILPDGKGLHVIEIGKKKPDFRAVIPDGSF